MNTLDFIIIAILLLSVLVGLWRGLISEVLALVIWIVAFWSAWRYGPIVSAHFSHSIETPMLRVVAGYGLCFIAVLMVGALVRLGLHLLVSSTGLGGTDRLFGMVFGFARGVLLVTFLVFLGDLTPLSREPIWQQSVLVPQFQSMAAWLERELPPTMREHLRPGNVSTHLPSLPKSLSPAGLPTYRLTSPAAAVSNAGNTIY